MFKKISMVLLTVVLVFSLTACKDDKTSDTDVVLSVKNSVDFDSFEISENITIPEITNDQVTYVWESNRPEYLDELGNVTRPAPEVGDQDVTLTLTIQLNDAITTKVFVFTVLAEELTELNTDYTDALTMDFTYDTTSFVTDGVGEVTLVQCIDGDTAIFTEGGTSFTVRFLGIDTPESTYRFDPWGKAASLYTCDKLSNASTIVLESDAGSERTDGNGRYLSWVWYDGRLLNLELVEEAYTGSKGVAGLKYEQTFYLAEFKTQVTDFKIWGEIDPNYDYSLDGVQITIEELVTNQELYVGQKVVIQGTISRTLEGHPYIQAGDYGIYLYKGYVFTTKLAEGNEVLISGLTLTYFPDQETGSPQLTGFARENIQVLSEENVVDPILLTIPEMTLLNLGSLVKFENLLIIDIYENTLDDAFTVTAEDSLGNTITIRRDNGANSEITPDLFVVGTTIDIVAPLGRYDGSFQLMIISPEDVTIK